MLFPLNQNIHGDDTQLIEHVHESRKSANANGVENIAELATNEKPHMEGPMTHSWTKQLMKANILISQCLTRIVLLCQKITKLKYIHQDLRKEFWISCLVWYSIIKLPQIYWSSSFLNPWNQESRVWKVFSYWVQLFWTLVIQISKF